MRASVNGGTLTISPKKLGTTKIRVQEGNGKKTTEITIIVKAVPITLCEADDIPAQTYTGSAFAPDLTVTYGNITLTKGTDYTVTYSNNTNAGTATATVTGVGNYAGTTETISKDFTINKAAQTWTIASNPSVIGLNSTSISISGTTYGTVSTSSNNTGVATVSGLTVKGAGAATTAGTATLTVTYPGDANHNSLTRTYTLTKQAAIYELIDADNCYYTSLSDLVSNTSARRAILGGCFKECI